MSSEARSFGTRSDPDTPLEPRLSRGGLRWPPVLLAIQGSLLMVATGVWMYSNGFFARPPSNDTASYRLLTYALAESLRNEGVWAWLRDAYLVPGDKPGLLYALGSLAAVILDPPGVVSPRSLWAASVFIFALFLFSTYRLARRWLPVSAAALAGAITASTPVVITYSRLYWFQMLVAALVLLALASLIDSRGFSRRGPSIACGVITLLACFTKVLAPIYLAGGYAAALILGLRAHRGARGRVLVNATIAVAIPAVSLAWYLAHLGAVLAWTGAVVGEAGTRTFSSGWSRFALARWLYFPTELVNNGFGFFLASCILVAVVLACVRLAKGGAAPGGERPRPGAILAASSAVAFIVLTLGQSGAHCQYVMWLVPLGCTILAGEILRGSALRRAILGGATGAAALASVVLSFRSIDEDLARLKVGPIEIVGQMDVFASEAAREDACVPRPDAEKWPNGEFADLIVAKSRSEGLDSPVVFSRVRGCADPFNLFYELARRGLVLVGPLWEEPSREDPFRMAGRCNGRIEPADREFASMASHDFLVVAGDAVHPPAGAPGARFSLDPTFPDRAPTGLSYEVLATRAVTPARHLQLVRLTADWRSDSATSRPTSSPSLEARFSNGWTLRAAELEPASPGMFVLKTRWSATSPRRGTGMVMVRVVGAAPGDVVVSPGVPLRNPSPAEDPADGQWSTSWCLPVASLHPPLAFQVGMFDAVRMAGSTPVRVVASDAPISDERWVTAVVQR